MIIWDLETGSALNVTAGHWEAVTSVAFSRDGKLVLSGSTDTMLTLWDAATGAEVKSFRGHEGAVLSVALSPDGRLALSGGNDGTVRVWDIASGNEARRLDGHQGAIGSVAFSPDGTLVLSGGRHNVLKLWDLASAREIRSFSGHAGSIMSVSFSPNGKMIVSASADGTVRLWDAEHPDEKEPLLATLLGTQAGDWITITPAGYHVAFGESAYKLLRVVHGLETYSLEQFFGQLQRPDLVQAHLTGDAGGAYRHASATTRLRFGAGAVFLDSR